MSRFSRLVFGAFVLTLSFTLVACNSSSDSMALQTVIDGESTPLDPRSVTDDVVKSVLSSDYRLVATCDFTGDGKLETLLLDRTKTHACLVRRTEDGWEGMTTNGWPSGAEALTTGHFTGATQVEVVTRNPVSGFAEMIRFTGIEWTRLQWTSTPTPVQEATAADLDQDGTLDLVIKGRDGRINVLYGQRVNWTLGTTDPSGSESDPPIVVEDGIVVITLLDRFSSKPINHATISIGAQKAVADGSNGTYTLTVPVSSNAPDHGVVIVADGYTGDVAPSVLELVGGQTNRFTLRATPAMARIAGFLKARKFESLYEYGSKLVSMSSDLTTEDEMNVQVLESGYFSVSIPASNAYESRLVTLTVRSAFFEEKVIPNIVAPTGASTRQLTSPIYLEPRCVGLVGTVADSLGGEPNQFNPFGIPDTVVVKQTGQTGNLVNGAFTIPGVPCLPSTDGLTPSVAGGFTLVVSGYNPNVCNPGGGLGVQETGEVRGIYPVSDGTANGVYVIPHIRLGGL